MSLKSQKVWNKHTKCFILEKPHCCVCGKELKISEKVIRTQRRYYHPYCFDSIIVDSSIGDEMSDEEIEEFFSNPE